MTRGGALIVLQYTGQGGGQSHTRAVGTGQEKVAVSEAWKLSPWAVATMGHGAGCGLPCISLRCGADRDEGGPKFVGAAGLWNPQLMPLREATSMLCLGLFLVCCHGRGHLQGTVPQKAPGSQRKIRRWCLRGPPLHSPACSCMFASAPGQVSLSLLPSQNMWPAEARPTDNRF